MFTSSAPPTRQYRPTELKAIDYVHSFKMILDATFNSQALLELVISAEGTPYAGSPEDYLRYELYPQKLLCYYPTRLRYYTTDGQCHTYEIRGKNDLDLFFHKLLEDWDRLVLPNPEDYLGCGYYYDDVEVLIVDSLNWIA